MPIPFLSRESPNLAIVDWCLIASQEVSIGEYVIEITLAHFIREMMEQSNNSCCLCRSSLECKGKGKQKKYAGRSCTQERKILEKFVTSFNLSRSALPTGGTLCYCCLSNLKKWDKMSTEIAVIQEQFKKYLELSPSCRGECRANRNKRTLSEAERETSEEISTTPNTQNRMADSSIPPEAEQLDPANKSLDMNVRVHLTYVCYILSVYIWYRLLLIIQVDHEVLQLHHQERSQLRNLLKGAMHHLHHPWLVRTLTKL